MSETKDITELLRRAFLEGFKVSCDGWNGEFPFKGFSDNLLMRELEGHFREAFPNGGQDENHG